VDGQIGQSLVAVLGGLWCMLCKQYLGIITMLICDNILQDGIWDVLHHHLKKYRLKNGFAFDTKNKLKNLNR